MKGKYRLLNILTLPRDGDAYADLLWLEDSLGFQEEESAGELKISAWFSEERADIAERIRAAAEEMGISCIACSSRVEIYDPDEWIASFNQSFSGIELEGIFFIHPPWVDPSPGLPFNILLEPGHAFGTGTHESTQLALLAMEPVMGEAGTFLDVGTGSGILAAAAGKINPGLDISICDIDDLAVESAVETLSRNGIDRFRAVTGGPEMFAGRQFQVVAANLTSPVIISLQPILASITAEYLIISGFTRDQQEVTLEGFIEAGFTVEEIKSKGGWVSSRMRKGS